MLISKIISINVGEKSEFHKKVISWIQGTIPFTNCISGEYNDFTEFLINKGASMISTSKNRYHQKNISSNQLFSNLFSKTVTFMKFLREIEFP